jgi:large subunit ribosomal protein L29
MKARDLADMSVDELNQMERDLKRKLFNLRFQRVTSELDNTAELGKTRKDIARVLTVMKQKENREAGA